MSDLSALFDNPELMQRLSEAGIFPDEMDLLGAQMKRAQALRQTPSAQGREVGNTYVASSPLEHLATGLQRVIGQRDVNATTGQQTDALGRMRANAVALAQALRRGGQGSQPPSRQWEYQGEAPVGLDPRYT